MYLRSCVFVYYIGERECITLLVLVREKPETRRFTCNLLCSWSFETFYGNADVN